MAAATHVLPLGLLRMRAFMKWVLSLHLSPSCDFCHSVTVTRSCIAALRHWRKAEFYAHGAPWGGGHNVAEGGNDRRILDRMGSYRGGQSEHVWPSTLHLAHINYLELLTVWEALNNFLPRLRGYHMLVRCDNTTAIAHINRQGGMRSSKLHALAHKLLVWSRWHFLSLLATHVPGILNRGADLLSRGNPLYVDWCFHPQRFGQAAVDLFASRENAHCPMFFSLQDEYAPLDMDALAHPWPNALLYAFPPLHLIMPTLVR